ncbi:alpha-glucosidase, family 31 of glycosyl hydrolases [Longilinea arvoryzae]|uniref:Alpha-glucosidase, family 31 of glycosyl hydrolases n=1 Tax=Longilinea arvoryzae TaxID=360412 RepID=A0A0S7B701_9CHLR|nr:TIM-barrel domain-containing protein [Longilinea arvoryzae]GAP12855.1 alpha-glucosidase, family 31 of glycosyl hydrolases [Longilinea arvoryzae]
MSATPESPRLTLRHEPYGEQHPYEPLPYERSPRDPWVGQPITLGVETGQNPAANAVWCVWQDAGGSTAQRVEGTRVQVGENADHWQIDLPAFSRREHVRYRLYAGSGAEQVESQEFSLPVSAWAEARAVVGVEDCADGVRVVLSTNQAGLFLEMTLALDGKGSAALRLKALSADESPKPEYPQNMVFERNWAGLSLALTGSPLQMALRRDSDRLALETSMPLQALVRPDGRVSMFRLSFASPADEAFYGFGERFNAFDQRGNSLDNYVYAQYTGQGKRSYIPVPFFISSRGYGLWLNTDRQANFDLAAEDSECWRVTGQAEDDASLELRFFFQTHPKAVVQAFTDLTGKPKLPPQWVFGLWMSSNDWNSQAEVLRQLHLTRQHRIPASVLVIEAWSDEINFYTWNNSHYTLKPASQAYSLSDYTFPADGLWPDPKAMIDELHQAGLRLVLWQIPALKFPNPAEGLDERQKDADQAYAIEQGYVVRKADGTPHRVEGHAPWFGNSLVLDFTNPDAERWWLDKRAYLVKEMGVDGFKTDGGEHIWDNATRFADGLRGTRGINRYPLAYEGAYSRRMESLRGDDHVLFSRAGYTGAQQVSSHWAGDESSTWEAFRSTIRAMLNAGMCGFSFMGWDIAGFAGPLPEAELYLRAVAFSAFCPIMQYHSDGNARRIPSRDRTPWNVQEQTGDGEIIPVFRKYANLRVNLAPYIQAQARISHQSGLPLMRGLPLEFPGDRQARSFPYEYLFGESLLVAPVVEKGAPEWKVYLPAGEWRSLWTGEPFSGPQIRTVAPERGSIEVYLRKGSCVSLNLGDDLALFSPASGSPETVQNLAALVYPGEVSTVELYQGREHGFGSLTARENPGEHCVQLNLERIELPVDLLILGDKPEQVCFNGCLMQPGSATAGNGSVFWQWLPESRLVHIHLPGRKGPLSVTIR